MHLHWRGESPDVEEAMGIRLADTRAQAADAFYELASFFVISLTRQIQKTFDMIGVDFLRICRVDCLAGLRQPHALVCADIVPLSHLPSD